MQKVFVLVTLLSMHTVQCLDVVRDIFRTKNVINVVLLSAEQKTAFVPLYQKYCTQQFQKAASSFIWRGIPAAAAGIAVAYFGMSSLGTAGASAIQGANTMPNMGAAIVSIPFNFALSGATWKGVALLGLAVPFGVYAGFKFMSFISRFIKSRFFYINRLYGFERGFDQAVRKKMSYPTVSYNDQKDWHLSWSTQKLSYNLLRADTMRGVFDGKLKSVQSIQVPQKHRK